MQCFNADILGLKIRTSSRSSVIHQAIALLRTASLEDAYTAAWEEWDTSEDAELWNATTSDGIGSRG